MDMGIPPAERAFSAWLDELRAAAGERSRMLHRPLVTLSYAQSLDGSISAARGKPLELSSPDSMRLTHQIRAAHSAVLVGIGTVLADDPQLTVRLAPGAHPQPVVLDSHLRFPLAARLLSHPDRQPWILCAPGATPGRQAALEERGAVVVCVERSQGGGLDLGCVLGALHERGVDLLMVEGGARIITRFLAEWLVDRAVITVAPKWVGGLSAVETPLASDRGVFPRLETPRYGQWGPDLVAWGSLAQESRPGD
jgi:3,4-dihydroxy 2-butanone 4-phosphate synthase/GTP cyclohydrolase II